VLDNFEQLLPAARDLGALLGICPEFKVLVTSRIALGVRGEHRLPVPPLALPDPDAPADPMALADVPAVALFVARAAAVDPDFTLTAENAPTVAALCRRLDGLPLALELAGARADLLPPAALLARLGGGRAGPPPDLGVLAGGPADLPERQRTLWRTLDWSYDLLAPGERARFARFAVFAGGATLAAIAAVGEDDGPGPADPLAGVAALARASLLVRGAGAGDEPRFGMLEMVRAYAAARLATSGEADAARRAHAAFFLALAERAAPALRGPGGAAWLARLDPEHDNLRAALDWAIAAGEGAVAAGLGAALWRYWWLRGFLGEGRRHLEAILGGGAVPDELRGDLLAGAGVLAWNQGDHAAGEGHLGAALASHRAAGSPAGIALCLDHLGIIARNRGDYPAARALQTEALALARRAGDRASAASLLDSLGMMARDAGDFAEAERLLGEGLALRRALGNAQGLAFSLTNLGDLARRRGDTAAARALLEEGLALRRELGDRPGLASSLNLLGAVARDTGDPTARPLLEEGLALRREVGDQQGVARSLTQLAWLALDEGDAGGARDHALEALALRLALGDGGGFPESLEAAAAAATALGAREAGGHLWGAAAAQRRDRGLPAPPGDRARHERWRARSRQALGERGYERALATGRALTPEDAVALARGLPDAPARPAPAPAPRSAELAASGPAPEALSPREREVAALIARGLTNRQIAGALFISVRTVDTHTAGIMRKLDAASRSQIAAWAGERGLARRTPAPATNRRRVARAGASCPGGDRRWCPPLPAPRGRWSCLRRHRPVRAASATPAGRRSWRRTSGVRRCPASIPPQGSAHSPRRRRGASAIPMPPRLSWARSVCERVEGRRRPPVHRRPRAYRAQLPSDALLAFCRQLMSRRPLVTVFPLRAGVNRFVAAFSKAVRIWARWRPG
jgi:predicted ATPase/DNA-binding CsgD family transcriptional regulator